jgi:hypothetical protein
MAKIKRKRRVNQSVAMLDQKTFQDFNNRKPFLDNPLELKEKQNPEQLNVKRP